MIKFLKNYIDKFCEKFQGDKRKQVPKMKRVNLMDKLKFKKIKAKNEKLLDENSKLNMEKVKEVALVVSAIFLIGIRIC